MSGTTSSTRSTTTRCFGCSTRQPRLRCPTSSDGVTLRFLGTRGEIDARSARHAKHSVLLLSTGRCRVLVDCGADWLGDVHALRPSAIVVTHAHADHAAGLRRGAPCEVYATDETWERVRRFPIAAPRTVVPRLPFVLCGVTFEAFAVEHSLRAPAVGYRITAGPHSIFYVPDVVAIPELHAALGGLTFYVGDGASLTRAIVRGRDDARIGHASIREQLDWCVAESVPRAVFTHCGSQILRDEGAASRRVVALGRDRGVQARLAHDGLRLALPPSA